MIDQGMVYKVAGGQAWIEMSPSAKCQGCAACQLLAPGREGIVAANPVNARAGERVEVEITQEANR